MSDALCPDVFAWKMRTLWELVARFGAERCLPIPLRNAIADFLFKAQRQVSNVLRHLAAGTLRRHVARRPPPPVAPGTRYHSGLGALLPRDRMWLVRLMPEAGQGRGIIAYWLETIPDLPAVLAQAPQLRRALGPLCTALGIRLPKRVRHPAPAPEPTPEPNPEPEPVPPVVAPASAHPPSSAAPLTPPRPAPDRLSGDAVVSG